MDSKQYDDRTEAFYKETGIWPPGRDMPAAMCGGEDLDTVRMLAYSSWSRLQRENERLKHYITRIGHRCQCSVWLTPKPGESGVGACDCGYEQCLKGGE